MQLHNEKDLVVNNKELLYKGIFRSDEIFHVINQAIEEKGYEKREKRSEELVAEAGKQSYIELRPFKEFTDYMTFMIKIKIIFDKVTETTEEINGLPRKFQNGDIKIVFDSWLLGDYQNRWGMQPWVYFVKGLINKYIYTFPLESGFKGNLSRDTAYIYAQIKKQLDSYKFESGKVVKEKDVIEQIAEEFGVRDEQEIKDEGMWKDWQPKD
ncbi:hypothetical protein HQ489_04190 [Candidatus Woesearchaeota archaeon]|nr:hypothetical protein [Candidatus Woesearchaeota archaeon]